MDNANNLGEKYSTRLKTANDKFFEAQQIVQEINSLTYKNTNTFLSYEDKLSIVQYIIFYIVGVVVALGLLTNIQLFGSFILRITNSDNKKYLDLISHMLNEIRKSKK